MKTILVFLSTLFICSVSFAQPNTSIATKLIKYIKLYPLAGWEISGDTISIQTRDSLIAVIETNTSPLTYIDSTENMAFFQGYCSFVLYPAKDGKDLLVASLNDGSWRAIDEFWQYDPATNILKDVSDHFISTLPSFKSFFPADFSFKGKDTTDGNFQIEIIPEKDTLTFGLIYDVQDDRVWLNKTSPIYEWIAGWNGSYFTRKKRKIEY